MEDPLLPQSGKASTSTASAPSLLQTVDPDSLTFDVAGIDASLANALRRILLSELPSVAIEHVFVLDNTSVVACEILSHRLGLVPLAVDPAALGRPGLPGRARHGGQHGGVQAGGGVQARRRRRRSSGGGGGGAAGGNEEEDEEEAGVVTGERVLSGALEWLPTGSELPEETGATFSTSQEGRFKEATAKATAEEQEENRSCKSDAATATRPLRLGAPRPVHDDILLARLRPGQRIELEAHATVGTGGEHAKWSPVATAWYRLQPELFVSGQRPTFFFDLFFFDLFFFCPCLQSPHHGRGRGRSGRGAPGPGERAGLRARLAGRCSPPRPGATSGFWKRRRRLSGEPRFAGKLALKRAKDHFIFCVESVGALPPGELVVRALKVLEAKCDRLMERI